MPPTLEGHKIIIVFAITGIIIAMSIILFSRCCQTVITKEGFVSPTPAPTSCPTGSNSFYDKNSNLMCCDGIVNGYLCEGKIVCSFSHNPDKYPSCNAVKRHKYNGPINPFIVQLMSTDFVNKFGQCLITMSNLNNELKKLPTTQISTDDAIKFENLLKEEQDWYAKNKKSPSIDYQEECMYVIETLTEVFKNKPIMNNKELINQQIKNQLCSS